MRKRIIIGLLVALLLAGFGLVVWAAADLPPLRMAWRYGLPPDQQPTGRTLTTSGIEFIEVGPGCFEMGSDKVGRRGDWLGRCCARLGWPFGDQPEPSIEMPVHWVEFPAGFWMARTEMTNEQLETLLQAHRRSAFAPGDRDPAVNISWFKAKEACARLSERTGLPVRLPSESEWECACRAGSKGSYSFADDPERLPKYGWTMENSEGHAHEVATLRANAWGLHDVHGNVAEWCEDVGRGNYADTPTDGRSLAATDAESKRAAVRIVRGGSWDQLAVFSRSAYRGWNPPRVRSRTLGFRPAFSLPTGGKPE